MNILGRNGKEKCLQELPSDTTKKFDNLNEKDINATNQIETNNSFSQK